MDKPAKHIIAYGIAGVGKSRFASTMPTPQWIAMFDAIGKETPYTDGTFVDTYEDAPIDQQPTVIYAYNPPVIVPTWDCFLEPECKTLIRRIVWFKDPDNTKPTSYKAYESIQPRLERKLKDIEAKTFILDSVTSICSALRNKFQAEFPASVKGEDTENSSRGWANRATDELEWINQFINSLSINTFTVCHSRYDTTVGRDQEYPQVGVQAYGRMKERFLITSGDVYRCFFSDNQYKVSVSADNLHVGNNSMKLTGIFPNDWPTIVAADKTNVTFVNRREGGDKLFPGS